jgi:cbb3-type cytochrome oxidase subunit 3
MLKQFGIAVLITTVWIFLLLLVSSCGSYYHYGKGKKQKVRVALRQHSCHRGCSHKCN